MKPIKVLSALASERRLTVLRWLENPTRHFPRQVYGDLENDGVCSVLIARKLGVSQPTTSRHMRVLLEAGMVRAKRIKQWTFYQRDDDGIERARRLIENVL